jgi:hypothetical protein
VCLLHLTDAHRVLDHQATALPETLFEPFQSLRHIAFGGELGLFEPSGGNSELLRQDGHELRRR